jgi:aspartyl-tRNA(Asn)/glutamyl-tRNA(Gln) amidotransferase subunit A
MTDHPRAPHLTRTSLVDVAAQIRRKDISPEDLTEAYLRACDAAPPAINAFAQLDGERAMLQARRLTNELVRRGPRSPLHGIPVAIKDLIDVAGLSTRAGSRVLAHAIPASADARVVATLRRAGAVMMGKTHTHEFALGVVTPQCRNPWSTTRITGGSSGGSAAAVAGGQCVAALGTDTGGSLRIPASLCGIATLKPRTTTLSAHGILPLSPMLDCCGPVAGTVADLGVMWAHLTAKPAARVTRQLRVGVVSDTAVGNAETDVRAAVSQAAEVLGHRADVELVAVDPPRFDDWDPVRLVPLLADVLAVHRAAGWYPRLRDRYGPDMAARLDRAATVTVGALMRALREIRRLVEGFVSCFSDCDVMLLPTTPMAAPRFEDAMEADGLTVRPSVARTLTRLCAPINWCGLAAVSVPCGQTRTRLPIGLQLVALTEALALACAERYEESTRSSSFTALDTGARAGIG